MRRRVPGPQGHAHPAAAGSHDDRRRRPAPAAEGLPVAAARAGTASRSRRAAGLSAVVGAAAISLLAAGCGHTDPPAAAASTAPAVTTATTAAPTTTEATTTTAAPVIPTWPLTGEVADAAALGIPAMAVKVDNSPQARPHAGINQADQVYELNVEGITRFMELFHSQQPERIGPVRSARSSDLHLLANLNRPLLVWSGGNPGVTGEVAQAEADGMLVDLSHPGKGGPDFYRDNSNRVAPHNLYTSVVAMRANHTPPDAAPPAPMFTFRAEGQALPASAVDAPGMLIDFGLGVRVEYVWDAERGGWDRFQIDELHPRGVSVFVDEAGVQAAPQNVVILFLPYEPDSIDAHSPKAISTGDGDGVVLTAGKAVDVHWSRALPSDPWTITEAASGAPVALTPGRTWVALPAQDQDHLEPLDAAGAAALLTYRK